MLEMLIHSVQEANGPASVQFLVAKKGTRDQI